MQTVSPTFNVGDRLDEVKVRSVGVHMPIPLHERLDQLCELVYQARHARPSKKKMLSALVLGAPSDADVLDRLLKEYDAAVVADTLVTTQPKGTLVDFPKRTSGPRPRRVQ